MILLTLTRHNQLSPYFPMQKDGGIITLRHLSPRMRRYRMYVSGKLVYG